MEVNASEMAEQIKQSILQSGKYARLEILVNMQEDIPYIKLDNKKAGTIEIAYLISALKEIIRDFETVPGIKELEKIFKLDDGKYIIKYNKNGKEKIL